MGRVLRRLLASAFLLTVPVVSAAHAGVLTTDAAAMAAWQGTTFFQSTAPAFILNFVNANVDFAVYEPGDFSTSTALGTPVDPSGGLDYVYAYQVFSHPAATRNFGTFNVGFSDLVDFDDDLEQPANVGVLDIFDGGITAVAEFIPVVGTPKTSAVWKFNTGSTPALPAGAHSMILYYTSPFPPEWDLASSAAGGAIKTLQMPSPGPVPEPSTLLLAGVGAAFLVSMYRRRLR